MPRPRLASLFLFTSLVGLQSTLAQPCINIIWDHTYGGSANEEAFDGVEFPDGSLMVVGFSASPNDGDLSQPLNGFSDGWVMKLNSSGFMQWERRYGGDGTDGFTAVAAMPDGGALLAGLTRSGLSGDVSQASFSPGQSDVWVVRIDAVGNKVWDKRFGGSMAEDAVSIIAMPDGGCFVAAMSNSPASGNKAAAGQGDWDYWLFRLDAAGNKLWDVAFGGAEGDHLHHAVSDHFGGVLMVGNSNSGISGNLTQPRRGSNDVWVVAVNGSGVLQWQRRYGGDFVDSGLSLVPSGNGWRVAGYTNSAVSFEVTQPAIGSRDGWVLGFDVSGTPMGDWRFGGTGMDEFSSAVALGELSDVDLAFAGTTNSNVGGTITGIPRGQHDYWLKITDSEGAILRDFRCGTDGYEILRKVLRTSDGGLVLIGETDGDRGWDMTFPSRGGRDFWLVKVMPTSIIMWYADADGDGFGDPFTTTMACAPPAGYVRNNWDCDDTDPTRYIGAPCLDDNNVPGILGNFCDCEVPSSASLPVVMGLEGPMDEFTGLMDDDLRDQDLLPFMEPYSLLGFNVTENPFFQANPAAFQTIGNKAIVDWVLVELRDAFAPGFVIASRAGLLLRDGTVVMTDGVSPFVMDAAPGNYHVAVRHRNHLGLMSASPITVNSQTQIIDLRDPLFPVHGNDPRVIKGNTACLWAGDVNGDGEIRYTGSGNDRDAILIELGGTVPTATSPGYMSADLNMDGVVKYAGTQNDRDVVLQNIGGVVPTATRVSQLP